MQNRVPTRITAQDFTPVPRKYRHDGWTAERQRAFIDALADTGSVSAAAKRINMSAEGAYYLRRQPGSDSFAAAWNAALDHGVQCLADIAIDRARNGVAVPVFWKGEQVGERRWYNDRLLMFILRHHAPERYGAPARLPGGTKSAETIAREAAENCPVCKAARDEKADREARAASDTPVSATDEENAWLDQLLQRYAHKVRSEREARLSGRIVEADFTLRQMTEIELTLDIGGRTDEMLDLFRPDPIIYQGANARNTRGPSAGALILANVRKQVWGKFDDPPRPTVRTERPDQPESASMGGGPTMTERRAAQAEAARRIAAAQAMWEAAASEEGWQAWGAGVSN